MEHGTHLIVGGDGLIGGALAQSLDERRIPHLLTTRRLDTVTGNRLFLDLGCDTNTFKIPSDVSLCYVCAAVTKQSECESNPDKTRAVNVTGAVNISSQVVKQGGFVVFLSTNAVFDGNAWHPMAGDDVCPANEYGRQKAEAESAILSLSADRVAVLRLSKVLDAANPLISSWVDSLRKGGCVEAFDDMVFAPVSLADTARFVEAIAKKSCPGVFHYSARDDISYYTAANLIARELGARGAVEGVSCQGNLGFSTAQNTALGMGERERSFGYVAANAEDVVVSVARNILGKNQNLAEV